MKYQDLSEAGKAAAIESWRENQLDFAWWACIEEDLKEQMGEKGITVETMYFSGFYSQGDGACFEGYVSDWDKFLAAHYKPEDKPAFRAALKLDFSPNFSCEPTGRYYHAYSVSFTFEDDYKHYLNPHDKDADPLTHSVFNALHHLTELETELEELEAEAAEIFQDHMKQLYRDLEAEHDYLLSDETIIENIEANDPDFDDIDQRPSSIRKH